MPELPEVETICRGLSPVLEGAVIEDVIIRQFKLRIPVPNDFRQKLLLRKVTKVQRRAKYLLIELNDGGVVIGHLGMSGRMKIYRFGQKVPSPNRHDHIDFRTNSGDIIRFTDPRRFGLMTYTIRDQLNQHSLLKNLGPEPLNPEFSGALLARRLKGRQISIKSALMDQHIVAGLGNIYICESLFRSGISPNRKAENVQGKRAGNLVKAIKEVLTEALEVGGSSLRDHIQPNGNLGYFQKSFQVYDREGKPCPNCNCNLVTTRGIKRILQAGRSTFYCPSRQR